MPSGDEDITDLTAGVYRRIYAGFLRGKKINSASLEAEAWFWRLHAIADDFGNLEGDEQLVHAATSGRRRVSVVQVTRFIDELIAAALVVPYEVNGDKYYHIAGFRDRQPAGKNGKRVKRYPAPPGNEGTSDGDINSISESGGIQDNPGESSATTNHSEDHNHSDNHNGECFERFWSAWPTGLRKVNRKGCLKHWQSAGLDSLFQQILSGLEKSKLSRDWKKDAGQFIPQPLTWLHQSRWEAMNEPDNHPPPPKPEFGKAKPIKF